MVKQNTVVYHELYGKGRVLDVKYRRGDSLLFCSFKKGKYGFITERQLIEGHGQITLVNRMWRACLVLVNGEKEGESTNDMVALLKHR